MDFQPRNRRLNRAECSRNGRQREERICQASARIEFFRGTRYSNRRAAIGRRYRVIVAGKEILSLLP
jgi:chorismate-pyruvate lyase